MHFTDLSCEQLAEQRTDVDAGKKIARPSRTLNGAGVVTERGMVQSSIHERSHGDRAAFTNPGFYIANLQSEICSLKSLALAYSLRMVTNTSLSPRQIRMRAIRPAGTFCSSRPASDALAIFCPFTERTTSP